MSHNPSSNLCIFSYSGNNSAVLPNALYSEMKLSWNKAELKWDYQRSEHMRLLWYNITVSAAHCGVHTRWRNFSFPPSSIQHRCSKTAQANSCIAKGMTGLQYKVKQQRNASTSCSETGSQNKKKHAEAFFFFFSPPFLRSPTASYRLTHCHTWLATLSSDSSQLWLQKVQVVELLPGVQILLLHHLEKTPLVEAASNQNSINTTCTKTRKTLKRQCCHMLI